MIENIKIAMMDLRQNKPLVLNLTNYVTMDFMANVLLAIGAAPIMTVCHDELEELIAITSTVNINLGTLDAPFIDQCMMAAKLANQYHKPIVLDPVGAGATTIRTKAAFDLLPYVSIVRGNASEIMALAGAANETKGVESVHATHEAKAVAIHLATTYDCTVVVSGPVDFITDGVRQVEVAYGSELMPQVTGMGCALTATIAAFKSVVNDPFDASNLATHYFTLCGDLAALTAPYPGSFRMHFIDQLYAADSERLRGIYVK